MPLALLAVLFILVPVLELQLLFRLGSAIGLLPTLALVVVTGLLGAHLARQQGLRVWAAINAKLAAGELPGDDLLGGALVLAGGVLLITPGIVTDLAGFVLLLPPARRLVAGYIKRRLGARFTCTEFGGGIPFAGPGAAAAGGIKETQARVIEDDDGQEGA